VLLGRQFAELLNQKKSKLTELQQRVTDLEAEVEQLRIASQVGAALGSTSSCDALCFEPT
jgi:peptidoglycan hydrolase CwlO-like protein